MARFFINSEVKDYYKLSGDDAIHVAKSLRMKIGETITLCDGKGKEYICEISKINGREVLLKLNDIKFNDSEPSILVKLYQGVPKSDKMDLIIQKSVELGVDEIIPVIMKRCISRPDEKSEITKIKRWQKISQEAAKQSRRGKIPAVKPFINFNEALKQSKNNDCNILFYEKGGKNLKDILGKKITSIGIFIGPEGGFDEVEVEEFSESSGVISTLGKRILRTETASLAALSVIMYHTNNM